MNDILTKLDKIEQLLLQGQKSVLTLPEVCELTGLSRSHIYRLTCTKEIPHYKRGNTLYFSRTEIEGWMLGNKVATTEECAQKAEKYDLKRHFN